MKNLQESQKVEGNMGCTNSVDGGEPNSAGRPGGNKKGHGTMGK